MVGGGQQFGPYELLERIDVGGMAEVFRAKKRGEAGFERVLAIKRILPSIAVDEEIVRMFIDEAKLAALLSHANIARVFDLGREGDRYFIAMEFVDGQSLRTLWSRLNDADARMPLGAACKIVEEVADALHYAHTLDGGGEPLGIIHRDVSPQNVLLSYSGEVKVIDFGLAKARGRLSRTRAGVVKGKLAYLSPEQAHGRPVDPRSDIFALGLCFWELLTGRRPFAGRGDRETILAIRRGDIETPSIHAPQLPREIERIAMKALAAEPDARYQTAREMHEALVGFRVRHQLRFRPQDLAALMRQVFRRDTSQPLEPDGYGSNTVPRFDYDEVKARSARSRPPRRSKPPPLPPPPTRPGDTVPNGQAPTSDTVPGAPVPEPEGP